MLSLLRFELHCKQRQCFIECHQIHFKNLITNINNFALRNDWLAEMMGLNFLPPTKSVYTLGKLASFKFITNFNGKMKIEKAGPVCNIQNIRASWSKK